MPFTPAGLWTPEQTLAVATNLNRAYLNAPEKAQQWGQEFYPEWHATAEHIAGATGQSHAAASAMLAHLSPANEAELNRIHALQLTHGGSAGGIGSSAQMRHIHAASAAAQEAQSYKASAQAAAKAGDMGAAQRFHEQRQTANAAAMAHRVKAGINNTPLQRVFSTPLSRAVHAREGEYADPLGSLGDIKLGDFGRMIHDPEHYQRPPIDTHYHDAAVNRTDIPYETKRRIEGGRYEGIQRAHAMAHGLSMAELGEHDPHSSYMATIWYAQQIRKAIENPGSLRSRKGSASGLENIRRQSRFQQWLPESHGLRPAFARVGV